MSSNNMRRKYNMSDSEFLGFTFDLCEYLKIDLPDFEPYGITLSSISHLKSLVYNLVDIFPDQSVRAVVQGATLEKNKLRAAVINEIGSMVIRVEFKWGRDSSSNKLIGAGSVRSISDGELLHISRYVHSRMTEYLPDLIDQGLTQQILDNFSVLNDDFELAMNQKSNTMTQRLDSTAERIAKSNELYDLAAGYCDLGKRIYANTDPWKYKNYLMYKNVKGAYTKIPENLIYDAASKTIKWSETQNATSYQVVGRLNITNSKWKTLYKGESTFALFKADSNEWIIRVRARNFRGYGDWSVEIIVSKV
jgi:hypothetical protein